MPHSTFRLFIGAKPYTVTIDRVGGNLDHFYHFIMDLAWPLHHWLNGRTNVHGPVTTDERALFFAPALQRMLGLELRLQGPVMRALDRLGMTRSVDLTGFNTRVGEHMRTFADVAAFRRSHRDFVRTIAHNVGGPVRHAHGPKVVLIERAPGAGDRGAARRSIGNGEALRTELQRYCSAHGVPFHAIRMEQLDFREQFLAMREGATVLIGQHGAGLLNGLWTDGPRCAVIELAAADNPPHFKNLYTDLGTHYGSVIGHAEGIYGQQQSLTVDPDAVVAELASLLDRSTP